MSAPTPNVTKDFFGKDKFTPFLGQVEDVNDPKMSGRVKVRCIGWHPKERSGSDEALPTEDLPWARVGMPTTHAQQSRIGGKHGLLAGSWVFGFFLDGEDAQDPMVISTFNFTSNASDKDNRQKDVATGGKLNESIEGYPKSEAGQENQPNNTTRTAKENKNTKDYSDETDKAGDNVNSDAEGQCGKRQSAASKAREEEMKTQDNPEGQNYKVPSKDGLCGSIPHARNDVQQKMQEMMPSALSRFNYGDVVWDNFSGNYMDLNGILAKMSLDICSILKMVINSSKAATNELNRMRHSSIMLATIDRVGVLKEASDQIQQTQDDLFNGIFQTSLIDILCSIIMNMLQAMNNGDQGNEGDNQSGDIGANPDTPIFNPDAQCIADTIIDNINTITEDVTEFAQLAAEERANNGGGSDTESFISSILGGLSAVMQFPLMQKYAQRPQIHNKAGDMSQAQTTKESGCRMERMYDTAEGFMGSMMGFAGTGGAGGGGGGGNPDPGNAGVNEGSTGAGSSNSSGRERLAQTDFGGIPVGGLSHGQNNLLCEEATSIKIPDPGYDGQPTSPYDPYDYPGKDFSNIPIITYPAGERGDAKAISLPSQDKVCARNFINGTPNQVIITNPGEKYFFNNKKNDKLTFPSIYIRGYQGNPVPVVDRTSGEMVAILTNCQSFSPNYPSVPINIIPDNSEIGITTDDPNYDIVLGGFLISNTGRGYCNPSIKLYDRDRLTDRNAEVKPIVLNGRIVDVEIINNGTGFKRIPEVIVSDDPKSCGTSGGYGARLYPIMSVVPRPNAKPFPITVQMIYCPAKNQRNLY